ncbi:type VII secretion protein EssC [Caproiciproducens galactitolivorans]|uniref:Type VII secretion protein EssC n=1 Tax=Caproiciproducens galactitolivorans TaxID=642589 RepID=A0ABT4BSV4_9FIRM|nr:type VII secretion protein EssC [Caproiciproducens galactitolivorans]MCY1713976.1 type VII secretion protein EssC [Caproiciproducens galactitolivorans]
MVVNLIKNKQMFSMTLPSKIKGQYWISDIDECGKSRELISVEAVNGEWVIKSNKKVAVLDSSNNAVNYTILNPLSFLNLKIKNSNEKVILFSEPISESRQTFRKIVVQSPCELTIGRTGDNCIHFENKFVSGKHAKLIYDGNVWSIIDMGSTNGTFVNGYRVESQPLYAGDYIYIMGLKIVVANQFFAINNPDHAATVKSDSLIEFKRQKIEEKEDSDETGDITFFYRSPRFKREIETADMVIDPPPAIQKNEQVPLAYLLGPSITMGLTSLSMGLFTLLNVLNNGGQIMQAMPTLMMSFSMLLGTVLWPILTKKYEKKMRIKNEKKRQIKYLAYLDSVRDEFKRKCKEQTDILNENVIPVEECVERIAMVKRTLWERIPGQDDFLQLKLGTGNLPLDANIKYPEKHFTMDDDNLQDALFSLGNEPKQLIDVPISISLVDNFIIGLIGNRSDVLSLVKSMLLQTAALHSYDEVKLMFIVDREEQKEWNFVKWFPHIWNDEKTVRFFASTLDELKELSVILDKNILSRKDDSNQEYNEFWPYYIVVSASKELADKSDAFGQMLKYKNNRGFSILTLYDEIKNLPKETSIVVEVNGSQSRIYEKDDITGKHISFSADSVKNAVVENVAVSLANIQMDLSSQRFALPTMITFLEMFHVGKVEHLNSLTRWKENNPTVSLQTPIGVDTLGEAFMLDLHEKFHGPHGLVAGMTGSGKSEFIITYILSLAVNYHPDEVAFILIDYKGGGLTGAFENKDRGIKLPHLAGTITNLDGAAINRSLISIQSELRRRQAIFNKARKMTNEGTMDIYKYQQLYRNKVVTEPVPHLFIISDEFAELKAQQPDFMDQLISAARIGRSLGIHLILATQKPSGVVNDQIWSNSKFRVCLKVQEKEDSMDMIKCPDAAELSQTGRFYLQVGFNELFALGQSAWCGAKYIPTENVEKHVDSSIQVIDNMGRVVKEMKPNTKSTDAAAKTEQVVAIVEYLSDLASEEHITQRQLWLDPIPPMIYVDTLEKKYHHSTIATVLNPIIGEYDDPFNQRQSALTLPLSEEGNCVVYGAAGNGKTTFLTTLVYSLMKNHTAEDLNIYIMDFGAETLRAFEKAPQVGGVLLSYENEKVTNLFKMLYREFEKRKQLFAEFGGDYSSYCKNSGKIVPNIVVILNNYLGFAEQYEDLDEIFTQLTRDGIKCGIHFVVSAGNTNAIRYRTLQNFKQLLTMQLNDPNDYSTIVGKTDGLIPSKCKGRGLIHLDRTYEFQTAHCCKCNDQFEFIRAYCSKLSEKAETFAKRVPVLPDVVGFDTVRAEISNLEQLPVGIEKKSLATAKINLASKYLFPVIAQDIGQLQSFTQCFINVLAACKPAVSVLDGEQLLKADPDADYTYVSGDFEKAVQDLFTTVLIRNNRYKESQLNPKSLDEFDRKAILILGLKRIHEQLSVDGRDKLKVLLERGEAIYRIHIVIADTANDFNSLSSEPWYRKHLSGTDGIWIGDGFTDQYVLKASKITSDLYQEIGDDFGYSVVRGKPVLVKPLSAKTSGSEGDGDE